MKTITWTTEGTKYPKTKNPYIRLAACSFGFLIPRNKTISYIEFANLICKYYDINNPKISQICQELTKEYLNDS